MVIHIRDYEDGDAAALMHLFFATVHHVNAADYTPAQIEAWAPAGDSDVERWRARFAAKRPFVAVDGELPVGFAELDADGHIDAFYVHHERQRFGIGTLLLATIRAAARCRGLQRLVVAASITARPFFARRGFTVVAEQDVVLRGETLRNSIMELELDRD